MVFAIYRSYRRLAVFVAIWGLVLVNHAAAGTAVVTVDTTHSGDEISPLIYGNNVRADWGPAIYDAETQDWRAKALEAIKPLRPPVIRLPGGSVAERYHWDKGVGPDRTDQLYLFGTDEWARFAQEIDAELMITTNWTQGTPEYAAQWVEYVNGAIDTEQGARRAAHGHPEPYHVKYWEIGNEPTHTTQVRDYARTLGAYAEAMKAVDPDIKIGGAAWQWRGWMNHIRPDEVPWTETLLAMAGEHLDFLIIHTYLWISTPPELNDATFRAALAYPNLLDRWLAETRAMNAEAGFPDLPIFVTEWNSYFGGRGMEDILQQHLTAVIAAGSLNSFIRADIEAANFWELIIYGWGKFANIRYPAADDRHFLLRPTYHVLKLYRDEMHGRRLPVEVASARYDAEKLAQFFPAQQDVPELEAVAARRADDSLAVACVWRDTQESGRVAIDLQGRRPRAAKVHALVAPGPLSPDTRIETQEAEIVDGRIVFTMPPVSAAVVVIE